MGDIPHGKVVPRSNHAEGSMVRYSCDDGYELIGDAYRICRNGQWTGTAARCQSRSKNQVTSNYGNIVSKCQCRSNYQVKFNYSIIRSRCQSRSNNQVKCEYDNIGTKNQVRMSK